jgi:hypothetical protein
MHACRQCELGGIKKKVQKEIDGHKKLVCLPMPPLPGAVLGPKENLYSERTICTFGPLALLSIHAWGCQDTRRLTDKCKMGIGSEIGPVCMPKSELAFSKALIRRRK